jgi:hypothetical protein
MKEVIPLEIDPRKQKNKETLVAGFFTGIGLALSAPIVAVIFRVADAALVVVLGG